MSNPFQLIHRYKKIMLVVFGVVLMGIFGLQPVFDAMQQGAIGGAGNQGSTNLVRFEGGSLSNNDIATFRMRHFQTQQFVSELQQRGSADGRPTVPQLLPIADESRYGKSLSDRMTAELILMAKQAEKHGIIVGDSAVDAYLYKASGGKVSEGAQAEMLRKRYGQSFRMGALRRQLKNELAALQFDAMLRTGLGHTQSRQSFTAGSPIENWVAFNRLNRNAQCDAMPINIKDFVKEVSGEPSANEMRELYEDGKSRVADPTMKESGFRTPNRAKLAYFTVNRKLIEDREMQNISDEQVQELYKSFVDKKDPMVIDRAAADESEEETSDAEGGDTEGDAAAEGAAAEDAAASDAVPGDESTEVETTEENESTEGEDTEGSCGLALDDEESTDEESTDEESAAESKEEPTEDVAEKKAEASSEEAADSKAKSEPEAEVKEAAKTQVADEDAKMPAAKPEESAAKESSESEGDSAAKKDQPDATPPKGVGAEPVKIKPLDEALAEKIRRSMLPYEKIDEQLAEAVDNCVFAVEDYAGVLDDFRYAKAEGERVDPPIEPNFAEVAKKNFASYGETDELLSKDEFEAHSYGSQVVTADQQTLNVSRVADFAFDGFARRGIYRPRTIEPAGRVYLVWYTEKEESHIPEFEECQREIVDFWKYKKAEELARKKAESIAKKLTADKQTLMAAYPEKAKSLGQFTWLKQPGSFGGPVSISSIPYVLERPGEEFMKTVFSLKTGEVGIAADEDNENIHVVQMMKQDAGEEAETTLRELYFRTPAFASPASMASQSESREIADEYKRKLFKDMGVEWEQ